MKYYYLAVVVLMVSVLASLCYSDYLKSGETKREQEIKKLELLIKLKQK